MYYGIHNKTAEQLPIKAGTN